MDIEERIIKAIEDTKDELNALDIDPTCYMYCSVLAEHLDNERLHNQIVSTTEYDYPYEHQFNMVPKDDDYFYIIDLKFKPFQASKFKDLHEKGYMLVNIEECKEYLDVVGNTQVDIRKKY